MTTVAIIVALCLYIAGIIITAGDALIDEHNELRHARDANMPILRVTARNQAAAARHRFERCLVWPLLLFTALRRLRDENYKGRTR